MEGVCAVVHSWARKVSWKKLDERMLRCSPLGEHLPSQAQLFHWLLTQAVGRMPVTYADEAYVALATGSAPAAPTGSPASGARFEAEAERKARLESMAREKPLALLWRPDQPQLAANLEAALARSAAPGPSGSAAAGQAAAAAGMPRQAAVEWGRALWHEHVACSWLAFLRGATRCLLTPEHACHAAFADDDTYPLWRYTNDVLRALPAEMHLVAACADSPEWANVSQTYAEWPAEATLSLADAARSLALHAQWGPSKGAAPRKAAGLLTMSDLGWRWRDDNNIFSLHEPPPLLPEPEADVLVRLARPADGAATALPEVKGRLKRALAHVDACVALFDHALHLHLYRWEYDSKSKCATFASSWTSVIESGSQTCPFAVRSFAAATVSIWPCRRSTASRTTGRARPDRCCSKEVPLSGRSCSQPSVKSRPNGARARSRASSATICGSRCRTHRSSWSTSACSPCSP